MNIILTKDSGRGNLRILEKSFLINNQYYDLIFKKSDEVFSVLVKDTSGKIHFHQQEIAEQLGIKSPTLDHFLDFIYFIYASGLNLKRTRDFQIKLLVEGCPQLFIR